MIRSIFFLTLMSFSSYGQISVVEVTHESPLVVIDVSGVPSSVCTFYDKNETIVNQKLVDVVSHSFNSSIIETDQDLSKVKYISCL